nr:piggyBac transposable element-derived protein 4-like [Parasteatoda tepidariorum]
MPKRKKALDEEEIQKLMLESDSELSDLSSEDDGWPKEVNENDRSYFLEIEELDEELDQPTADFKEAEKVGENNEIFTWKDTVDNNLIPPPISHSGGGPCHDLPKESNPFDFFKLLFTPDMMEQIRINTNKYAKLTLQKTARDISLDSKDFEDTDENDSKDFPPITDKQELWNFIACLFAMSINKLPRLTDYWSKDPLMSNAFIKSTMQRNRFLKILRCLHLSDRESEVPANNENYHKMQKLYPFMADIRMNFRKCMNPYKDVSVDEALIKYKGRLGFVQYLPLKPGKRGIKVWMLCTSRFGYVLNFEVYCGKNDKVPRSGKGLGYDVIQHLCECLKNPGHNIYFDRFFTSVPLVNDLLKKNTYCCGTLNLARKSLPQNIKSIKLPTTGMSKSFQCVESPNIICTLWKDKKEIALLSSNSHFEESVTKRRIGGDRQEVKCPITFLKYNSNMGGVDLADQNRKYYNTSRKSRKWWQYLFWFLLDTAVNNSFILYSLSNTEEKKHMKLLDYKMLLIKTMAKPIKLAPSTPTNLAQIADHVRVKWEKKCCRRCAKLKVKTVSGNFVKTTWICQACQVSLCIDCFGKYHDEMKN